MTPLILASASVSRAKLLRDAAVPFTVQRADVDENAVKLQFVHKNALEIALALAERKALQVSQSRRDAIVLGSDQLLVFEEEIVSKSADAKVLAALLRRLRGKTHRLVTAAALAKAGDIVWRHVEASELFMRNFSEAFLGDYLAREGETVFGCVGGYRLEGPGAQLFERIRGDYFSILGLPLLPVLSMLREHGVIAE